MPPQPDQLLTQAYLFAQERQSLLNNTVTDGIAIRAVLDHRGFARVGRGVSRENFVGEMVPLRHGGKQGHCLIYVAHSFFTNPAGYLTDATTSFALYLEEDFDAEPLLRYEYVREPDNPYPVAHLHVHAQSSAFDELFSRAGREDHAELPHLHFPVGGKRYRPSLEDLVEFLIRERLVEPRTGWETSLSAHREEWFRKQLSAAVKGDPQTAQAALDEWHEQNP